MTLKVVDVIIVLVIVVIFDVIAAADDDTVVLIISAAAGVDTPPALPPLHGRRPGGRLRPASGDLSGSWRTLTDRRDRR